LAWLLFGDLELYNAPKLTKLLGADPKEQMSVATSRRDFKKKLNKEGNGGDNKRTKMDDALAAVSEHTKVIQQEFGLKKETALLDQISRAADFYEHPHRESNPFMRSYMKMVQQKLDQFPNAE
jgi:hypothetical protein